MHQHNSLTSSTVSLRKKLINAQHKAIMSDTMKGAEPKKPTNIQLNGIFSKQIISVWMSAKLFIKKSKTQSNKSATSDLEWGGRQGRE